MIILFRFDKMIILLRLYFNLLEDDVEVPVRANRVIVLHDMRVVQSLHQLYLALDIIKYREKIEERVLIE